MRQQHRVDAVRWAVAHVDLAVVATRPACRRSPCPAGGDLFMMAIWPPPGCPRRTGCDASVARRPLDQRHLLRHRLLPREAGSRVVLAHHADHGTALPVGGDERRRHARHAALHQIPAARLKSASAAADLCSRSCSPRMLGGQASARLYDACRSTELTAAASLTLGSGNGPDRRGHGAAAGSGAACVGPCRRPGTNAATRAIFVAQSVAHASPLVVIALGAAAAGATQCRESQANTGGRNSVCRRRRSAYRRAGTSNQRPAASAAPGNPHDRPAIAGDAVLIKDAPCSGHREEQRATYLHQRGRVVERTRCGVRRGDRAQRRVNSGAVKRAGCRVCAGAGSAPLQHRRQPGSPDWSHRAA